MKNELISIIIPVYNMEKYITDCIDSVLAQTYGEIEIVLVDDGSTDNSGLICDQYAEKDDRIKVIHKQNGGASSARNTALDLISGSWVMFVDSDDLIAHDTCEVLLSVALKQEVDISCACERRFYGDKSSTEERGTKKIECFDSNEMLNRIFYMRTPGHTVCKLFRREVVGELRFPDGMVLGEDTHLLLRIIDRTKRIAQIDYIVYYYRQIETSAIHSHYSHKMIAIQDVISEAMRYYGERSREFKKGIMSYEFFNAASLLGVMGSAKDYPEDRQRLVNAVKETRGTVLTDDRNSKKVRFMALVGSVSPGLLGFMMSKWNILRKKLKRG